MQTMSTAEREALIVERRSDSVPFRAIAAEVGLSLTRVHDIYREACARIPTTAMHTLRVQSADLADRAIHDLLQIAENPQISPRTRAECWGQLRGWSESLRKLYGVDAPTRREITVISDDAVSNAIVELNREIAALDAQAIAAGVTIDA
jgi:hypothetical protein